MNDHLPKKVTLIEVGPRDGFQFETQIIPTEVKAEIIGGLVEAGLTCIQVTSFVHPARVPQMADAEELVRRLPHSAGIIYSGLVLNTKGVERAYRAGLKHIEVSISASDTHSRKNAGMTFNAAIQQVKEMIRLARTHNMFIRAGIQCAFGCAYEGDIPGSRILEIVREYISFDVDAIVLSDTTGMANPVSLKRLLRRIVAESKDIPIELHLHDTRGLGLVNVVAALECEITRFDTALAGMGGCPFVPGAAGNIATEDTAYLMASMGIETGIDIAAVVTHAKRLEKFFNKQFAGKVHRLFQQPGFQL
jgi:hydroxymethylglutaryl-CoA lyase